jgi:hypothetical protein
MDSLVPHQKDKMIPLEKLTSENALYWRCLAQYLHAEGAEMEEELDKIIPNLTPFCQYIRRCIFSFAYYTLCFSVTLYLILHTPHTVCASHFLNIVLNFLVLQKTVQ